MVSLMIASVTPLAHPDIDLASLRTALAEHGASALVLTYGGRTIAPGYHVTEIKAAQFAALDCGGNPDRWTETVLQVEDLTGGEGQAHMPVRKLLSILGRVDTALGLDPAARVTIEISRPGEAMQVFDIGSIDVAPGRVTLDLAMRPAICKPRHRAAMPARAGYCGPSSTSACCA